MKIETTTITTIDAKSLQGQPPKIFPGTFLEHSRAPKELPGMTRSALDTPRDCFGSAPGTAESPHGCRKDAAT